MSIMSLSPSFLRPCLRHPNLSSTARYAHLRLFEVGRRARVRPLATETVDIRGARYPPDHYPRVPESNDVMSSREFSNEFTDLQKGETRKDKKVVIQGILESPGIPVLTLTEKGRVKSIRTSGKKLMFLDTLDGDYHMQHKISLAELDQSQVSSVENLKQILDMINTNSYISQ